MNGGGGGKINESTHVVLLWVSTGERQRAHDDPFLLLKRFHQEDSALLGPAVETRRRKSREATKQEVEQQFLPWRGGTMNVLSKLDTGRAKKGGVHGPNTHFPSPVDRKTQLNTFESADSTTVAKHDSSLYFLCYRELRITRRTVIKRSIFKLFSHIKYTVLSLRRIKQNSQSVKLYLTRSH